MSKRKCSQGDIESFFDEIKAVLNEGETDLPPEVTVFNLKRAKEKILNKDVPKTIAANEFSMERAIRVFGLKYQYMGNEYFWNIEDIRSVRDSRTSSLDELLDQFSENFDRSTKAACRPPIDLILNECLSELKGTPIGDRHRTPSPYQDVKICCEVSFSHKISPKPTGKASTPIGNATSVNGRVDYGVGIVSFGPKVRLFHSLLLAVGAKPTDLGYALPQLIVYLACLRQGREAHGRRDCSVYGVTSDGLSFRFATITHQGVVKVSKIFSIATGDMQTIKGFVLHILRTTMERSPTVTPEKTNNQSSAGVISYHDAAIELKEIKPTANEDEDA